jgi:hypothetical protein
MAENKRRDWQLRPLVDGIPRWRLDAIAEWRAWLRDALNADPESLDDGPRPSDLNEGEK